MYINSCFIGNMEMWYIVFFYMRVYLFYDILFIYGYISIKGYIFDIVFEMLFLCFKIISINVNEFRK